MGTFLEKFNISNKIFIGFSLLLCLLLVISAVDFYLLKATVDNFKRYRALALQTNQSGRVQANLLEARVHVKDFIINASPENINKVNERAAATLKLIDQFKVLTDDQEKIKVADDAEQAMQQYLASFKEVTRYQAHRNELVHGTLNKIGPKMERGLSAIMKSAFDDGDAEAAYLAGETLRNLLLARLYVSKFLVQNDAASYERVLEEFKLMKDDSEILLASLENPMRRALAFEVNGDVGVYQRAFLDVHSTILARNHIITHTLDKIGPKIAREFEELKLSVKKEQDTLGPQATAAAQSATITTLAVSLFSIVFAVLAALFIGRSISHPIRSMTSAMTELSEKNFDVEVPGVSRADEIGLMAQAVGVFRENMIKADRFAQRHLVRKLWAANEQSHSMVLITDSEGSIEYANPRFAEVTGYSINEVIGQNPRILQSSRTPTSVYEEMWGKLNNQETWSGELINRRKDGSIYWEKATIAPVIDRNNETTAFIAVKDDISIIKEQEQQLRHQAYYDGLTNLPNRILAYDRLEQGLKNQLRENHFVGVLFIDLDDFKNVNDTLGHQAGDVVLVEAAKRLSKCVRKEDTVGRQGGDEFIVILPSLTNSDILARVAEKIITEFQQPFAHQGMEFHIGVSIGIVVAPTDGEDPSILMRNADLALYKSKDAGKNTYSYFTNQLSEAVIRKLDIERNIKNFKDSNELFLVYQPIVDAVTEQIIGAEALLRWDSKELGSVSPGEFIPVIEQSDIILDVGQWVLEQACLTIKDWKDNKQIADDFFLSVNVSPRQFRTHEFPLLVANILMETNASAQHLKFEVTETLLLSDVGEVKRQLDDLRTLGIELSLDDFGTGYSSMVALKKFPFTTVKIDKTFIDDVENDEEERLLCAASIAMGRSLKLKTIVEGVETQGQLDFARENGCHQVQGYFTGRPMSKKDFEKLI